MFRVPTLAGPLHYADVTYFDDAPLAEPSAAGEVDAAFKADAARKASAGRASAKDSQAKGSPVKATALVKESLQLYYGVTDRDTQKDLEGRLGPTPTPKDPSERSMAMSMWLAAACVSILEECKQQAGELISTRSTVDRLRRVVKVQRAAAGKRFSTRK